MAREISGIAFVTGFAEACGESKLQGEHDGHAQEPALFLAEVIRIVERAENQQDRALIIDRQRHSHGEAFESFVHVLFRLDVGDGFESVADLGHEPAGE